MNKRLISILVVLTLIAGCVFALAETVEVAESPAASAAATVAPSASADTTEVPAEPAVKGKTRYVSAPSGLYIRETPDLEGKIVATPDFNYALTVIGEEGKWSHVLYESNGIVYEGYAWTEYLSAHKTVLKAKATPAPEVTPEVTPVPEPKPLLLTGDEEG